MSACGLDIHYSEELTHLAASRKDPDGLLRLVREDVRSLGLPDDKCRIEQGSGSRTLVVRCRWDDGIVGTAIENLLPAIRTREECVAFDDKLRALHIVRISSDIRDSGKTRTLKRTYDVEPGLGHAPGSLQNKRQRTCAYTPGPKASFETEQEDIRGADLGLHDGQGTMSLKTTSWIPTTGSDSGSSLLSRLQPASPRSGGFTGISRTSRAASQASFGVNFSGHCKASSTDNTPRTKAGIAPRGRVRALGSGALVDLARHATSEGRSLELGRTARPTRGGMGFSGRTRSAASTVYSDFVRSPTAPFLSDGRASGSTSAKWGLKPFSGDTTVMQSTAEGYTAYQPWADKENIQERDRTWGWHHAQDVRKTVGDVEVAARARERELQDYLAKLWERLRCSEDAAKAREEQLERHVARLRERLSTRDAAEDKGKQLEQETAKLRAQLQTCEEKKKDYKKRLARKDAELKTLEEQSARKERKMADLLQEEAKKRERAEAAARSAQVTKALLRGQRDTLQAEITQRDKDTKDNTPGNRYRKLEDTLNAEVERREHAERSAQDLRRTLIKTRSELEEENILLRARLEELDSRVLAHDASPDGREEAAGAMSQYRPLWRGQEDAAHPLAEARIHSLEAQLRVEKAAREVQSRLISAIEPVLTVGDPFPV